MPASLETEIGLIPNLIGLILGVLLNIITKYIKKASIKTPPSILESSPSKNKIKGKNKNKKINFKFLKVDSVKLIPLVKNATIPTIKVRSAILAPIIIPAPKEDTPENAEITPINNSGRIAIPPMKIKLTTNSEKPQCSESNSALLIASGADLVNNTKPIIINKILKIKSYAILSPISLNEYYYKLPKLH